MGEEKKVIQEDSVSDIDKDIDAYAKEDKTDWQGAYTSYLKTRRHTNHIDVYFPPVYENTWFHGVIFIFRIQLFE